MTDSSHNSSWKRLRIRELSRYYCVTSSRPSSPIPRHISSNRNKDALNIQRPQTTTLESQPLANQPQLVALAQLALLRTNAERSFISIIDNETQFVVAEATRSVSVYDPSVHAPGDGPLIGAQAFQSHQGICPKSFSAFLGAKLDFSDPNNSADTDHVLIGDLLSEKSTCASPLLKRLPPVLRYYLDVPLRTASGYVLGSICVVDSVPKVGAPRDVDQLTEVAKLVVEQLEYTRLREDHARAQRLLEGLSHFAQGQSSLSLWSRLTRGQENIPDIQINPAAISSTTTLPEHGDQGEPVTEAQPLANPDEADSAASTVPLIKVAFRTSTDVNSTNAPSVFGEDAAIANEAQQMPMSNEVGISPLRMNVDLSDPQLATSSPEDVRQAFSRASNLIRESMDLDATCFLELPQNARYSRIRERSSKIVDQRTRNDSSLGDYESLTDSSTEASARDMPPKQHPRAWETGPSFCHRLGFSTTANSSVANSNVASRFLTMPAKLLSTLAQKYPDGHIFHFDEAGVIASSGDEQIHPSASTWPKRRRKAEDKLFSYFQNARSMIFFPLYDNDRQHVYAAFLGWTNNPARALQQNEIVYVSAFADSLMCEVMRLSAVALDKAKSNFISSISHELRSPLHGILAACQLLSESERYPHQGEFISMVDICAHTLLDTMDHVLDYAKINQFTEKRKQRQSISQMGSDSGPPSEKGAYSLISRVNLAALVEDTVTSIAAGSQQLPVQSGEADHRQGTVLDAGRPSTQIRGTPIPIVLNIHPYTTSFFNTEPGSWRRIVMNLVGNSIKYTSHGHISVDFRCYEFRDKDISRICMAELKVTDTGCGISEQYLRHRLYTPFAQENNLSVGSGLGLSMVNQIVSSLKGQIQVQSEIDSGTQIVVRIPIEKSSVNNTGGHPDMTAENLRAHSIGFAGFDAPAVAESAIGVANRRQATILALKSSVSDMATNLLDLRIVQDDPDIYVIEQSFLESHLDKFDLEKNNLLVIGLDGRNDNSIRKLCQANYHYTLPPLGPERMKEALKLLMHKDMITPEDDDQSHHQTRHQQEKSAVALTKALDLEDSNSDLESSTSPEPNLPSSLDEAHFADDDHPQPPQSVQYNIVDSASASRLENPAPENKPLKVTRSSVLLVDDNDINLRLLVACVKRLPSVNYMTAVNGKQALEKFQAAIENGETVPVVLMDVSMPIMDGLESTRRIRAYEKNKAINHDARSKVIAVTGLGSGEAQNDIEGCGFDLYLRKPVNLQIIREVLTESGMIASN